MGLSFATLANPLSDAASPVLSQWFYLAFAWCSSRLDAHLALVRLLLDSYHALPVGAPIADVPAFLATVPEFFGTALARAACCCAAGDDGAAGGEPCVRRAVARGGASSTRCRLACRCRCWSG
jgi:hypothetical protein